MFYGKKHCEKYKFDEIFFKELCYKLKKKNSTKAVEMLFKLKEKYLKT